MLNTIQQRVEEKLKANGVEAYIYAFEMTDDGLPYFAYTYNKEVVEEAKEDWENGFMPMGCYDDYSFEDGINRIVEDIYLIITNNENRTQND